MDRMNGVVIWGLYKVNNNRNIGSEIRILNIVFID